MGFIHGANRHEEILFPERLDDYIAAENPVRFIDAFVDHPPHDARLSARHTRRHGTACLSPG